MNRKPRTIPVGLIIFGAILIYLIVSLILYVTNDHTNAYEVIRGRLTYDSSYTGLILRDEHVIETAESGYIAYYHPQAQKIRAGSPIYALTNEERADHASGEYEYSGKELASVENVAADLQKSYDPVDFENVYDHVSRLEAELYDVRFSGNGSSADSLPGTAYSSDMDGVIAYTIDGMEQITREDAPSELRDRKNYSRNDLRAISYRNTGDAACKLITDENWSICIRLDEPVWRYLAINEINNLQVRVEKDHTVLWADVRLYDIDADHFAQLCFQNSMVRYLSDRYLEVTLIIEEESGLKIPQSAVAEREFLAVPSRYCDDTMTVYATDDDGICYIPRESLMVGTLLTADDGSTFTVSDTVSRKGVYNVNKGYAVFKLIEIKYENEDYCIVKEGTDYGISHYDYIALHADSVKESDILH